MRKDKHTPSNKATLAKYRVIEASRHKKSIIKRVTQFTNGAPLDFIIECDNEYYDLTPLFAEFMLACGDKRGEDKLNTIIDMSLAMTLRELVVTDYTECKLKHIEATDEFDLERVVHHRMNKLFDKAYVGKLVFDFNAVFHTATNYSLFPEQNKGYECYTYAAKLATYFRSTLGDQKIPSTSIGVLLDLLLGAFMAYKQGKPVEDIAEVLKVPTLDKDFLWLVICGYTALCKKYNNAYTESITSNFKDMLAEYGDYTSAISLFLVRREEVEDEHGKHFEFDYVATLSGETVEVTEDSEKSNLERNKATHSYLTLWFYYYQELRLRAESTYFAHEILLMQKNEITIEKEIKETVRTVESNTKTLTKRIRKLEKTLEIKEAELVGVKEKLTSNDAIVAKNKQIADLMEKLQSAENENQIITNKLVSTQNRIKTLEERTSNRNFLETNVVEQAELLNLREIIAQIDTSVDQTEEIPLEEMKLYLKDKKIMVVGGPAGFDKRLETIFNDFTYIDVTEKGSNFNAPGTLDCMVIISRKVGHAHVFRAEKLAKSLGIPYISIHVTNLDIMVRMLYVRLASKSNTGIE